MGTPASDAYPGVPVVLFPAQIVNGGVDVRLGRQYDVAPDGRFLINTGVAAASSTASITLIQNWQPDAKPVAGRRR